jgi:hypothetical protein
VRRNEFDELMIPGYANYRRGDKKPLTMRQKTALLMQQFKVGKFKKQQFINVDEHL